MTNTDYGAFVELGRVLKVWSTFQLKNVHPGKIVSPARKWKSWSSTRIGKAPDLTGLEAVLETRGRPSWPPSRSALKSSEVRTLPSLVCLKTSTAWLTSGKGDMIGKVLDVDIEKERISLGIKQLTEDLVGEAVADVENASVTCTVSAIVDNGIEVRRHDPGFHPKVGTQSRPL